MMRNSGSSMQYICIYATVCGVTSLLALYGTMEHMNVAKSAKSLSQQSSDTELAGNSPAMREAPMDRHLQAIDAKMQLVLQNASLELSRFGHHVTDWDKRRPLNRHNKILLASSSQARECENAHGDHVLLKALKNKVNEFPFRIHRILQPEMANKICASVQNLIILDNLSCIIFLNFEAGDQFCFP